MPRKYRAKRAPAKKRVYRKKRIMRRRQNNPSKMVFRPKKALGQVAPERYLTKLKGTILAQESATDGVNTFALSGNSVFDFAESKGTESCPGLSQLAALYKSYVVYGSKCVAEVLNTTTTNKYVVLFPCDGTAPTTIRSMMDAPFAKSKALGANTGNGKVILSNYMSSKRIFGAKDLKDEEKYTALVTASPTENWQWILRIDNNTGAGTDTINVKIIITYYVEFFNRVQLNQA